MEHLHDKEMLGPVISLDTSPKSHCLVLDQSKWMKATLASSHPDHSMCLILIAAHPMHLQSKADPGGCCPCR